MGKKILGEDLKKHKTSRYSKSFNGFLFKQLTGVSDAYPSDLVKQISLPSSKNEVLNLPHKVLKIENSHEKYLA